MRTYVGGGDAGQAELSRFQQEQSALGDPRAKG